MYSILGDGPSRACLGEKSPWIETSHGFASFHGRSSPQFSLRKGKPQSGAEVVLSGLQTRCHSSMYATARRRSRSASSRPCRHEAGSAAADMFQRVWSILHSRLSPSRYSSCAQTFPQRCPGFGEALCPDGQSSRGITMDAIESVFFYSALLCLTLIATAWIWT